VVGGVHYFLYSSMWRGGKKSRNKKENHKRGKEEKEGKTNKRIYCVARVSLLQCIRISLLLLSANLSEYGYFEHLLLQYGLDTQTKK